MPLAALLMETRPKAPVLHEHVLDAHCQRRADPREGIDHQPDQRRSRRPAGVATSIASNRRRASDGSSTGVFPHRTLCDGPRTEAAGFTGTT